MAYNITRTSEAACTASRITCSKASGLLFLYVIESFVP